MVANVEAMVRTGIEAYRSGKKAEARKLLEKAIELDDYNEQAWMWLSAVVETEEEQRTCLENVLVINPDNEEAKRGLKMLGVGGAPPPASSSASPFGNTPADTFDGADFTADTSDSGDDWLSAPIASSSASATFQGDNLTSGDYDDWVSGLNLGSSDSQSAAATPAPASNAFGASNIDDMFGLGNDTDFFDTDDPFASEPALDDDDDMSSAFTSGPFGSSAVDDDFGFDPTPAPPAKKPATPVKSPGAENVSNDSLFAELDSAGFSSGSDFSGGDFFTGEDFDADNQQYTADELFSFIPDEISATRLPGTSERLSVGSFIVFGVLIAMNIGAVLFLVSSIA